MGIRQPHLTGKAEVDLEFNPAFNNEEAGVSVFYKFDAHFDIFIGRMDNQNYLCFRKVVGDIVHIETKLLLQTGRITIKICASPLVYHIYALIDGNEVYLGQGLTRHVSTEAHELGFTGVFYALYASGNGNVAQSKALFTNVLIESEN